MSTPYPRDDMDYSEIESSIRSILDDKFPIEFVAFFPAANSEDTCHVAVKLTIEPQETLLPEEYEGICSLLLRYFRNELLTQAEINIFDPYKAYGLDENHQIIHYYTEGKFRLDNP